LSDYEFSKKPHRMTSPPANERRWLPGYEGVGCKLETDPTRIAILCREATWGSVFDFEITPEIIESTMAELEGGKVLGAAFEVPAFAFVMRGSRSTMDQLLRLRESAGASHTTRDNDFRDFNIIVPNTIVAMEDSHNEEDSEFFWRAKAHVEQARKLYGEAVDRGIPPQDARYLFLPMGYQGDWVQVMNLRALIKECEQRLCNGLTQHESNYMVRLQRDLVVEQWPWMDKLLRSTCEKRGMCVSRSMLFPPCGAFGYGDDGRTPMERVLEEWDHNGENYLYPPEQNDAMTFAQWDVDRKLVESDPSVTVTIPFSRDPREDYG
jgi:hypothetical protein